MKVVLNRAGILWAVGVLQPVSAVELSIYLNDILGDAGQIPAAVDLHRFLMESASMEHVVRVHRDPDLFSLSLTGNAYLSERQRKSRDASRIFLLRDSIHNRVHASREGTAAGSGDAASPQDASSPLKGSEANTAGLSVPQARPYWPRYSKQLTRQTGPSHLSRDALLSLLSFENETQVRVALKRSEPQLRHDYVTLATMIGISPKLIQRIVRNNKKYYRSFELPKRSGGTRTIQSPRVFLKVIQKFLADYILYDLPVHHCVHSYRTGKSVVTNAEVHTNSNFVANLDIDSFFDSISTEVVASFLASRSYDTQSSFIISQLLTKDGQLPQGSPASPLISNSIMYSFDVDFERACARKNLKYTRYADDITISGDDINEISAAIKYCKKSLADTFGFQLNSKKTRIAINSTQQTVTGVVVNEFAQPSRTYRRKIRAGVHNFTISESPTQKKKSQLAGAISYLESFPHLRNSEKLAKLKSKLGGGGH